MPPWSRVSQAESRDTPRDSNARGLQARGTTRSGCSSRRSSGDRGRRARSCHRRSLRSLRARRRALILARKARLLERPRKLGDLGPFFNRWPFRKPRRAEVVLAWPVLDCEPNEHDPSPALRREEPDDRALVDRRIAGEHDVRRHLNDGLRGSVSGLRATGERDQGAGGRASLFPSVLAFLAPSVLELMSEQQWKRADAIARVAAGKLTMAEAARIVGLSVRQLRRLRRRMEHDGRAGLRHGNRGREPGVEG